MVLVDQSGSWAILVAVLGGHGWFLVFLCSYCWFCEVFFVVFGGSWWLFVVIGSSQSFLVFLVDLCGSWAFLVFMKVLDGSWL